MPRASGNGADGLPGIEDSGSGNGYSRSMRGVDSDSQGTSGGLASDESEEDGADDYVLSEETLHKLPPQMRAIAARTLAVQRENAELRASLVAPDESSDDSQADLLERREREIQAVLDMIPEEGTELLSQSLKKIFGPILSESAELRAQIEQLKSKQTQENARMGWEMFKESRKDWEKYDAQMAAIIQDLGVNPRGMSKAQFDRIYRLAKSSEEVPRLSRELETEKRAGPVPRLGQATQSLRSTVKNANEVSGRNWTSLVTAGILKAREAERSS